MKITILSVMSIAIICMIAIGGFFWRLSLGGISLDFMRDTVVAKINENLPAMTVRLAGVTLERDPATKVPQIRLRNLELLDKDGNTIIRAPRAAISVDESALFTGTITPHQLDLIGPRIMIKRAISGGFVMGFGKPADDGGEEVVDGPGKSDQGKFAETIQPETSGEEILEILGQSDADDGQAGVTMSSVDFIKVSQAAITLFDESNNAYWNAPSADLVFKRMPYGFAVVANASIQSEADPIRTEISASYRREQRNFSISARISDFVPSEVSRKVFALSQLAKVNVPLSGHAELEMAESGQITKGTAEFTVGAGELGFPEYISEPISVDEGSLRFDYDPATGGAAISDSSIVVGRSRVGLTGRIDPLRDEGGVLQSLKIALSAKGASLDAAEAEGTDSLPVDRIDFAAIASINTPRVDLQDLIVMKGDSGIRLRGDISGGERSPAIHISGRARNMSAALLKRIWPPIVAPNTRKWVNENIKDGEIADGDIVVRLEVNELADSKLTKALPDDSITLNLALKNVTSAYFKDLPLITGASGAAKLLSNTLEISLDEGSMALPSGQQVSLSGGIMTITDLLKPISPAELHLSAATTVPTVFEYMRLPDLNLLKSSGLDVGKLSGDAAINLALSIPLMKDLPRESVKVTAKAKISNASLKGALKGIDITDGQMQVSVEGTAITGQGPVKLNGIPAKLTWIRTGGPDADQSAVIETELDDKERAKIGANLGSFLTGPIDVKATIPDIGGDGTKIKVEADLSKTTMMIDVINWVRGPTDGTRASFTYNKTDDGAQIDDLSITGGELKLAGDVKLTKNGGFSQADMSTVNLNDENRFGIVLKKTGDGMAVTIDGESFDARPLIKSMFGKSDGSGGDGDDPVTYLVSANVGRVYAHRGEVITGLNGSLVTRAGTVLSASLTGNFLSGQPITMRISPAAAGREFRIGGRDAGSALRAANLYSKIAGGQIEFYALMGQGPQGGAREGQLVIRDFEVRNEAALAELDRRGKPKQNGPRSEGIAFKRLKLPFTADPGFIRIKDAVVSGNEICATADGVIRKSDSAIDIDGTIVPACGLNNIPGKIPVVGILFGEGLFALTYAMGGSISKPVFQYNPASALAPGFLRKFFEFSDAAPAKKGTNKSGKSN